MADKCTAAELLSTQKCVFLSVINEKAGVCVCKHVFTRVFTFEFGHLTHRFQDLKVRHPHQEKILMMKTMNCSVYSTYIITTTLIYSTYKYRGSVVRTFTGHTLPSVQLQYKYTRNQILTWCENGFARYTESAGELFSCLKCTLLYLSLTGRCACSTFLSCLSHTH